jgi:alpha-glucosidase
MPFLSELAIAIRFLGLQRILQSVRYSRWRDRQAHSQPPSGPPAPVQSPGLVSHVDLPTPGSAQAVFHFPTRRLTVTFLAPDLARLVWQPGQLPYPYAIARQDWPAVRLHSEATAGRWNLASDALSVTIHQDGAVEFSTPEDRLLRREAPPEFRGDSWTHRAPLSADECIFGLGERAAPFNLRGGAYRLWNIDPGGSYHPGDDPLYLSIPVFFAAHSGGSYMLFYENSWEARLSLQDEYRADFTGGALQYYFIPGPLPRSLSRFTELTGRPPMPPRWSLGYHQSRWGYKSEADIREVLEGFKTHRLPLDAIHLDIDYMDGYRVFTVDPRRFPDLAGLAAECAARQVRLVTILDPGVKIDPQFAIYREGLEQQVYVTLPDGSLVAAPVWPGWCHFPDFTSPHTRRWWGSQYPRLLESGISGFWHDMNEPAALAAWGERTLPLEARHHLEGRQADHSEAHNLYGLLMSRAGFEALHELQPSRRPWLVSRSGWAGLQRYSWSWTADVDSTWENLRQTIPTLLGLSLSGIYFSGSDIGGFSRHPDLELYLRWFQLAAFTPFFRMHSSAGLPPREPWRFGEPALAIVRGLLELRRCLQPYLYTLAWQAANEGLPLMRPLLWEDERNPDFWEIQDAFMLGDSLLVAPVLEAGSRRRSLLLPPGDWVDFWDGALHPGPGPIILDAPLEKAPLLVRCGSLLPLLTGDSLELHVYAQSAAAPSPRPCTLYSDAGDGYGPGRLDRFTITRQDKALRIAWETQGEHPWTYPATYIHLHGISASSIEIDGRLHAAARGVLYLDGPFRQMVCRLN